MTVVHKEEQELTKKQKILAPLNEQQRAPVIDYHGGSIVTAAAGSGKTSTIVARTAYMIEDGIPARDILLFTFTRKGADEIKSRVQSFIGEAASQVTMGTYHSFCARFLRRHIDKLNTNWNKSFSIYDETDKVLLLKSIINGMEGKSAKIELKIAASLISRWKEKMLSPVQVSQSVDLDEYEEPVVPIYSKYMLELQQNNAVDFDDLIYLTIRILENNPEVLQILNSRFKYIVADEVQDSSPRDLHLIELLGGNDFNVCLVGDDWQSKTYMLTM